MYLLGILTREYSPDSKHLKTKKINRQVVNTKRESFLPLAFFMRPSMKPKSFNDEPEATEFVPAERRWLPVCR